MAEKIKSGGRIRLHHLTDLHDGAPDFAEAAFKQRVQSIAEDSGARWTFGGDGGDLIRFNDRRYQPTELAPRYRQATDMRYATLESLERLLAPIKDKCWGLCEGNHERKYDEHYGGKFLVELCCNLGLERLYVGYRGFVHVNFELTKTLRVSQLIDLQHGWQAGRSSGAFVNQAERELSMTEADIVLRGHSHKPGRHMAVTLGVTNDCQRVHRRHRTVVNGGSWRYGYRDNLEPIHRDHLSEVEGDLWSEAKGFRAEHLGGPIVELRVDAGLSRNNGRGGVAGRAASVEHAVLDVYASAA